MQQVDRPLEPYLVHQLGVLHTLLTQVPPQTSLRAVELLGHGGGVWIDVDARQDAVHPALPGQRRTLRLGFAAQP